MAVKKPWHKQGHSMDARSQYRLHELFNKHVELLRLISQIPDISMDNEDKLKLYSLYTLFFSDPF